MSGDPALATAGASQRLDARVQRLLARPLAALQKLSTRDRLLLLAATLALVAGLEFLVVLPLHDKRMAIAAAAQLSIDDRDNALAEREQAARERDLALDQRAERAGAALESAGASTAPRESLRFLLSRTLQQVPVKVLSLRALASEEVVVDTPPSTEAVPVAEAASAAAGTAPLYRHRYELRVSGSLDELLKVIDALERQARPLRVERVQLRADAVGALQAGITLVTLGSERTWLSL